MVKSGQIYKKDTHWSDNDFFNTWGFFCATFSFSDIVDFVLKFRFFFMLEGLTNQVRKILQVPSALLITVEYKIDHVSNTGKKNLWTKKSVSEHCASFGTMHFFLTNTIFLDKNLLVDNFFFCLKPSETYAHLFGHFWEGRDRAFILCTAYTVDKIPLSE